MPTANTAHLPAPKNWDEFEDICADLFSHEWDDANATRYGRQGQRQNGVDIYGTSAAQGGIVGVQCKGRRAWPPPPLTTGDIDAEVAKAKKFEPALRSLTIATTAPDDAKIQDHVRKITKQHARDGAFAVHIVGWGELTRRLTQYGNLVEKYYGFVAMASLRKEIQESADRTAALVAAKLGNQSVQAQSATEEASAYDVFISYASEDRNGFVRPLAEALRRRGLSVCYDEFALTVGDSLTASIDEGLSRSRYGIVVLSKHFFAKRWTKRELGGLVSKETARGKRLILPIWLGLTRNQVVAASPTLADVVGIDGGKSMDDVCDLLLKRIKPAPIIRAAAEGSGRELRDAAERDLEQRYRTALRRHLFTETADKDEFSSLGLELIESRYDSVNPALRRMVLLRAARSAAVHGHSADAKSFLTTAEGLKGDEPALLARARIADADDNTEEAIRLLRDHEEPESRSVLLSILDRRRGPDAALEWWNGLDLPSNALSPAGICVLAILHIKKENFEAAKEILDGLATDTVESAPALLLVRAATRMACLFARPERAEVLGGIRVGLRRFRPILTGDALAAELDAANSDLTRLLVVLSDLGLASTMRLVRSYLLWCDLLHPMRSATAIAALQQEMAAERPPLEKLSVALDFIPGFCSQPIAEYLKAREEFGGLDENELFASLVLHLHGTDARSTVEFVSRYRERLGAYLTPQALLSLEIQALAKAGDAVAARGLYDEKRAELDPVMVATLEAEVAKAEGADPVAVYQRAHATANTVETLRVLIDAFAGRGDHRAAAEHALQLYGRTNHPDDIAFAVRSFARAGRVDEFVTLADAHPFVLNVSHEIAVRYAWEVFRRGRLEDARKLTDAFAAKGVVQRDLNLEISLAIESGNWEAVAQPLEVFRANPDRFVATDLMRAANVARATGQSAFKELARRAVQRDGEDASILVAAYSMALEDGSDGSEEARLWFQKALALSGPDGPLRSVDLKEIIRQQRAWNERSQKVGQHITRGEIPLASAAKDLGTTAIDIVLRNLVRSEHLTDARERTALPLFSGRRSVATTGPCHRAAFDTSALLVLGWLDLLTAAFEMFPEIVLPSGAMQELFEGAARLQRFQRSRLTAAEQVRDAILHKGLKRAPTAVPLHDALAKEVGNELASLLYTAEKMNGVVVRPAPVHRIGLGNDEDADLTPYAARIADTHALLAVLSEESAIDGIAETTAAKYFTLQDRKWPSATKPDTSRPLLIDGLALTYLQTTGLLDAVLKTFNEVYVDASAEEESTVLLDYGRQLDTLSTIVTRIRKAVHDAFVAGKVVFSPRRAGEEGDDEDVETSATLNLISDLKQAEVVIFDDRMLNGQGFASDAHGHRARTVTSLDLIEELRDRQAISADERRQYRNRLRRGGAALVPVDAEEIEYAASRSTKAPSPEFRAIRDSIDLARVAGIARFPAEIPWFASLCTEAKNAVMRVWNTNPDRAAAISDLILGLRPTPEDWLESWEGTVPPNWPDAIHRVLTFGLTLPFELDEPDLIAKFNQWLEQNVLAPERDLRPSRIEAVADQLRHLILNLAKEVPDEE